MKFGISLILFTFENELKNSYSVNTEICLHNLFNEVESLKSKYQHMSLCIDVIKIFKYFIYI